MSRSKQPWFLVSMMLIAANLRLPITIIPPLLPKIEHALALPSAMGGLLTSIPLVTFAIFSPIIVKLAQRWGNSWTVFSLFLLLIIGSYLRLIPTVAAVFCGTFLIGIGVDSGNVLIPALIKENMPDSVNVGTGLYTLAMLLIGALGTAAAGFLIGQISLPATLGWLSVLSIVAALAWIPNLRRPATTTTTNHPQSQTHYQSVWHQPLGWLITLFFGLQALVYYSFVTWLPGMLSAHGIPALTASNLLTILQISGLPLSFLVPFLFNKRHGVSWLIALMTLGYVIAPLGFLLPTHALSWLTLCSLTIGVGAGVAFNLAVLFFTEKTTNPIQTAAVSGMAQSAGYLLAAVGPLLFGYLQSRLGTWLPVIGLLALFAALLSLTGVLIQRHGLIAE